MTSADDNNVYIKRYHDRRRRAAAHAHLNWLTTLDAGVQLPVLRSASPQQLVFEHLGHRQPGAGDLGELADALGRLHAAAHVQYLHPARLDQPFLTPSGMVIADFVTPRHNALLRLPLTVAGLPAAIYKDANISNFLLTDHAVAIIDFDDPEPLSPFAVDRSLSTSLVDMPGTNTAARGRRSTPSSGGLVDRGRHSGTARRRQWCREGPGS